MERWREELYQNSLMHYGVKGMRKGVRRFQNADGSLTAAGERRYLDPRTASQLRERAVNSQQASSRPVQGTNRVVTSTRQRESLEGGDRNRRVAAVSRGGHMQRVQDVEQTNRPESRPKEVFDDKTVKTVSKQGSGLNGNPNSNKTQPVKGYDKSNRPQSRPKNISEDTTVKDVEKREPVHGYGYGVSGQTQAEYREKQRQELLARAERERAAVGKTANPPKTQDKKNSRNSKKKKTVDDFKKKGERYVAKKTR